MVADGAYGSEPNIAKAAEHGIRLITTNFYRQKKPCGYFWRTSFFSEDGRRLLECANHKNGPIRYGMMNTMTAVTHSFVRVIA